MDTHSFFTRILGSGLVMLAVPVPNGDGIRWKHFAYESQEEAAAAAAVFDGKGLNVYHACATYQAPHVTVEGKRKYRVRENVARVKTLWLDLDCGEGKDYPTQDAAFTDISRFVHETGLPEPMIVNSGNGLHCYWPLEAAIPPDLWLRLATKFRAVVDAYGVKQDGVCTSDVCRVLRPVGTHNRKAEAKPVVLMQDGVVSNPVELAKKLASFNIATEPVIAPPQEVLGIIAGNNDLAYKADYPPSSAHEIAKRCSQVEAFATVRGDVSEPMWYAMLGLLKHTVEGEAVCQEWSSGHPQYNADSTRRKMEQWVQGPTTCAHFSKISSARCEQCPFKGKVSSPIHLGQVLPEMKEEIVQLEEGAEPTKFELPEAMQGSYSWDGTRLFAITTDKKGMPQVVAFCDYLFWPIAYHRLDGKMRMIWRVHEPLGKRHEFELSGAAIATGGVQLFTELGQNGIVANAGQKRFMEMYITDWFNDLKKRAEETTVFPHFGWQSDWSFVLGEKRFTPEGEVFDAKLAGDAARPMYRDAFVPRGTLEEWRDLVDKAYNYPGQEQYQFLMGVGFGAPLLRLFENYGGVTVNGYSPEKGLGKSTALKFALGVYGNPKILMQTQQQVSPKAYLAHCGILHSLPVGIDEATNIDPKALSDTVYAFSQGTGRRVLTSEGKMNPERNGWSTIQIWTANRSMISALGAHKANADAEMGRMLEFQFTRVSKFTKAEADELLAKAEVLFGQPGQIYIPYIVANRVRVTQMLQVAQRKIDERIGYTVQDRHASAGITCVIVGLVIAKQLGLVAFDVDKLLTWVVAKAKELQEVVAINSPPTHDVFGRMLSEISSGFIVTHNEGDARTSNKIAVVVKAPNGAITGRLIQENGELFVQQGVIRQWCSKNQADYGDMFRTAVDKGWVKAETVHYSLGKGTKEYGLAPTRCWHIDVRAMHGEKGETKEAGQLRVVK